MDKQIFIVSSVDEYDKVMFSMMLETYVNVMNCMLPELLKDIARKCGWKGACTKRDMEFINSLERLISNYSGAITKLLDNKIKEFNDSPFDVLIVFLDDIKEIDKLKIKYNAKSIYVYKNKENKKTGKHYDYQMLYHSRDKNSASLIDYINCIEKDIINKYLKGYKLKKVIGGR